MLYILHLLASTFYRATTYIIYSSYRSILQETPSPENLSLGTMKHIVILGGSFGGVGTAHRILKQASKIGSVKVTLVAPNTDFYMNVASVRGIIPGQISDEQLFKPIAPGFAKYSADQFEFVVGSAESLDVEARKVIVSGADKKRAIDYDYLVLATGSRTKDPSPLKALESTEDTKAALQAFRSQIEKSETIVVAGAGVTGVEVAGELGCEYRGRKKIILVRVEWAEATHGGTFPR
jgi:NADH dehydrogenase FAD-containing subunit